MNEPHPLDQNYDDDDSSADSDTAASKHPASQLQDAKSQDTKSQNSGSQGTGAQSTSRASDTGPSRSVLRVSLIALAITAFAVFLTAVAASNAPPNSSTERVASVINRIVTVLLLISFLGILISYQIPKIQKLLVLSETRPINPPLPLSTAQFSASSMTSSNIDSPSIQPPVIGSPKPTYKRLDDFLILLGVNVAILIAVWMLVGVAFGFGSIAYLGFLVGPAAVVIPGLLITMIVWHEGCLRAYAIGALTAFACLSYFTSYLPMLIFSGAQFGSPPFGGGAPSVEPVFLGIGFAITGIVVSGLLPAAYVKILISRQADRD